MFLFDFRTSKTPKNRVFNRILAKIHDFPVYTGHKKSEKMWKNADEVSGFLTIFWPKSQYMGPLQTPKTTQNRDFGLFAYPPLRL